MLTGGHYYQISWGYMNIGKRTNNTKGKKKTKTKTPASWKMTFKTCERATGCFIKVHKFSHDWACFSLSLHPRVVRFMLIIAPMRILSEKWRIVRVIRNQPLYPLRICTISTRFVEEACWGNISSPLCFTKTIMDMKNLNDIEKKNEIDFIDCYSKEEVS